MSHQHDTTAATTPNLSPAEFVEWIISEALGSVNAAEEACNKLDADASFDTVLKLWAARKNLKDALAEVGKLTAQAAPSIPTGPNAPTEIAPGEVR